LVCITTLQQYFYFSKSYFNIIGLRKNIKNLLMMPYSGSAAQLLTPDIGKNGIIFNSGRLGPREIMMPFYNKSSYDPGTPVQVSISN
jgi:hypothetical protein